MFVFPFNTPVVVWTIWLTVLHCRLNNTRYWRYDKSAIDQCNFYWSTLVDCSLTSGEVLNIIVFVRPLYTHSNIRIDEKHYTFLTRHNSSHHSVMLITFYYSYSCYNQNCLQIVRLFFKDNFRKHHRVPLVLHIIRRTLYSLCHFTKSINLQGFLIIFLKTKYIYIYTCS